MLLVVATIVALRPSGGQTPRPAPAFTLENLAAGRPSVSLDDRAGRPALVNFWASWCAPCVRELPALGRAHGRYGDRVAFLGIDNQDARRLGLALFQRAKVPYPSGYDPKAEVAKRYSLRGMPTTIFVTADGRIAEQHAGPLDDKELAKRLDKLL